MKKLSLKKDSVSAALLTLWAQKQMEHQVLQFNTAGVLESVLQHCLFGAWQVFQTLTDRQRKTSYQLFGENKTLHAEWK